MDKLYRRALITALLLIAARVAFAEVDSRKVEGPDGRNIPVRVYTPRGLPPAMIITAQIDPLRSVAHEFFGMAPAVDVAKQAQSDASAALKRAFAGRAPTLSKTE